MTNQGDRQQSVRDVTGTTFPYNGDWHALFDSASVPLGTYNERLLAWINLYMGTSFTNTTDAMQAFAEDQGYYDWDSMGDFDANIPSAGDLYFTDDLMADAYFTDDATADRYYAKDL
jgi:hypothetical protein